LQLQPLAVLIESGIEGVQALLQHGQACELA